MAGSSSTTRISLLMLYRASSERLALEFFDGRMPHISPFDDINHLLGHVLGMVADALDGFRDPQNFKRLGNRARIFHHEGNELPHDRAEFLVDREILAHDRRRGDRIEAR